MGTMTSPVGGTATLAKPLPINSTVITSTPATWQKLYEALSYTVPPGSHGSEGQA